MRGECTHYMKMEGLCKRFIHGDIAGATFLWHSHDQLISEKMEPCCEAPIPCCGGASRRRRDHRRRHMALWWPVRHRATDFHSGIRMAWHRVCRGYRYPRRAVPSRMATTVPPPSEYNHGWDWYYVLGYEPETAEKSPWLERPPAWVCGAGARVVGSASFRNKTRHRCDFDWRAAAVFPVATPLPRRIPHHGYRICASQGAHCRTR